jgi:hypothetical protein
MLDASTSPISSYAQLPDGSDPEIDVLAVSDNPPEWHVNPPLLDKVIVIDVTPQA